MTTNHLRALAVLLIAPCDGRGAAIAGEAANNFGEAMRIVALIMLGLSLLGAALYVWVWVWLVRSWRRGRASLPAAVLLLLSHLAALLLSAEDPEVHRWFWWTAALPAAALALAVTSRRPLRLAAFAAATAGLCLLPADPLPMRALPGPIVDLSSAFTHACVLTDRGVPVCAGPAADACGPDRSPSRQGPQPVPGVTDATRVFESSGRRCFLRESGALTCCGGETAGAHTTPGPWTLPVDRPITDLVVTSSQILARTGDDLHGWPHPLPPGLTHARALAAHEGIDTLFAAVDRAGALWMWRQDGPAVAALARFDGLADAAEVAIQPRTGACVRRTGGAVTCFPWPADDRPPHDIAGLRAAQLVALDDSYDRFCARLADGAVRCWEGERPPEPFTPMPYATRLVSASSALCDVATHTRCVAVWDELDHSLRELLALQPGPR